jgi:hypothetical protein
VEQRDLVGCEVLPVDAGLRRTLEQRVIDLVRAAVAS